MRLKAGSVALAVIFLAVGCATTTPEQAAENNLSKGDSKMEQAMNSLVDVEADLDKNQVGKAQKAFNKAIGYVDQAVVYYAKAVTTPDQKDAVKDLQSGLAQMKSSVESLEKNDVAGAQSSYTKAQQSFDAASSELWAAG
jgi:hypothetical protein